MNMRTMQTSSTCATMSQFDRGSGNYILKHLVLTWEDKYNINVTVHSIALRLYVLAIHTLQLRFYVFFGIVQTCGFEAKLLFLYINPFKGFLFLKLGDGTSDQPQMFCHCSREMKRDILLGSCGNRFHMHNY